jgi:hypothetical protein
MRPMLLTFVLVVAVLAILHRETHANGGEPTHCGFWGAIEAGLSCR